MFKEKFKFLSYGRLSLEFKDYVDKFYSEVECKQCSSRDELENLLPEVNALAGFDFVRNLDLSHIKWYHSFAAGVDTLVGKNFNSECIITRTSGQLGPRIGEYCLAYILHDLKGLPRVKEQQVQHHWSQFDLPALKDQRILILGTGTIGEGVAKILKPLCAEVVGVNRIGSEKSNFSRVISFQRIGDIDRYDIVINALPLTHQTRGLVSASFFSKLQNVLFINVGRGATISESDLLEALSAGTVRAAVLDVFVEEPLPENSEFWKHKNIIVTPHHSGLTTIEDVIESFEIVYPLVRSGKKNQLFVDKSRQY